jgi:hypothetical protein
VAARVRLIVVVAAAGLFVVAACSSGAGPAAASSLPSPPPVNSSSSEAAAVPYRNSADGYSFVPPPAWAFRPTDPQSGLSSLFSAPTADLADGKPFVSNINVIVASTPDDLDKTIAETKQAYPTSFVNYQLLADEAVTLTGGRSGHLLGGSYDQPGSGSLRNLQLFVVDAGKNYVVSATTPAASFGRYESALRSSLLSFTLG